MTETVDTHVSHESRVIMGVQCPEGSRSYEARESDMRLIWDPAFAPLREDAGFHELTCKLNRPPGNCTIITR